MVVPTYQDGKTEEYFNLNVEHEDSALDTRKAGNYLFYLIFRTQTVKRNPIKEAPLSVCPSICHKVVAPEP